MPGALNSVAASLPPSPTPAGLIPALTPRPGSSIPGPNIPTLTSADQARAKTLFDNDARARQILGSRPYTVVHIGPWTTVKDHKQLGAVMQVSVTAPITGAFDWPGREYDAAESSFPPYRQVTNHYSVAGASDLLVWIDLANGKVVGIQPGPGARITLAPGCQ